MKRTRLRPSGRLPRLVASAALALTGAVPLVVIGGTAASATPSVEGAPVTVDSGDGWTVAQSGAGYTVTLTLPSAIKIGDNYPVLLADGKVIGPAAESEDGLSLSITTGNPSVAKAKSITGEMSGGGELPLTGGVKANAAVKAHAVTPGTGPILSSDPTTSGGVPYLEGTYNFGAQAQTCINLNNVKCEVEGKYYLPTGNTPHPLVIFLHGRHSSCYKVSGTTVSTSWPCPVTSSSVYAEIPSWAGYDAAGEALASNGYTVVSIGANSINANDAANGADAGAAARGQEILDTLTWLKQANAGQTVSFFDAATSTTRNLDQALANGLRNAYTGNLTATQATAADFVNSMDFDNIGVMGHSRGGEGAATAVTLNAALANPWHIKSAFLLAPIDFTRDTVPDVITTTLLPYCDGDVSDQQGQHFYADSRNTRFDDNVQKSDILVMGTDHDFYNTDWTPPTPSASDDWSASTDAVCGASSATSQRLTAAQQNQVGGAYVAGFFEATLGGQSQYQAMFDGTQAMPPSVSTYADVRSWANQPSSQRSDIATFEDGTPLSTTGNATSTICANRDARTATVPLPYCTTTVSTSGASNLLSASAQQPFWTPASYAPNVTLNQMEHLTWTAGAATDVDTLSVAVPASKKDVSGYQELTVKASPDQTVGTANPVDFTMTVSDGSGHTYSSLMSTLNQYTVKRMPASTSSNLGNGKLILQQISVPTSTIAAAGVDLTNITSVSFTVADPTKAAGEYFQDLAFDTKGLGTPNAHTLPSVNVQSLKVEEGSAPSTTQDKVAVYLSQASSTPVTAYLTVVGSATGRLPISWTPVTFAAGTTCQAVAIPSTGDTATSTTNSTAFKIAVSFSDHAVLGVNDFGTVTVREDDGVTGSAVALAPYGTEGDPCAEKAALTTTGTLTVTPGDTLVAGAPVTITGTGYRAGESVTFTGGGAPFGSAIADASGNVTFTGTVPLTVSNGPGTVSGVGFGSGYTSAANTTFTGGTTAALPDSKLAALLPVTAVLIGGLVVMMRRRRRSVGQF